jgi:hypothetical protein
MIHQRGVGWTTRPSSFRGLKAILAKLHKRAAIETCMALKRLAPLHRRTVDIADLSDANAAPQHQLQTFDTVIDHPSNRMLTSWTSRCSINKPGRQARC